MSATIQADENGALLVPPSLLPNAEPLAFYRLDEQNGNLVIAKDPNKAPKKKPFWKHASGKERAEDILRWAASHKNGPALPDSALGRDAIYE